MPMLNESQRRRVSAILRVTEERLLNFQEQLSGARPSQALLDIENDLSEWERAVVGKKVSQMLLLIAEVRERFDLTPSWQSLRRALIGGLTLTSVGLQDAKAAALRAYGEAAPQLAPTLDPLIDGVIDGLAEICRILGTDACPARTAQRG
jgi:hypothetical protein